MVTKADYGKGTGVKKGGKNEAVLSGRKKPTKDGKEVFDKDVEEASREYQEKRRLLEKYGYEDASPAVIQRLREKEALEKQAGGPVVRVNDQAYALREGEAAARQREERRAQSVAVNVAGYQQVPGLMTQSVPASVAVQEDSFSREPDLRPIGSSRTGDVLYSDSKGKVFLPSASTENGEIFSEVQPKQLKLSEQILPSKNTPGFATPGLFLGEEKRRDVIKFGEFVEEKGESYYQNVLPDAAKSSSRFLQGATLRNPVADYLVVKPFRSAGNVLEAGNTAPITAGKVIQYGGYNPKKFVFENVVLPETVAGVVLPRGGSNIGDFDAEFYGGPGPRVNRASRLGLRTANKPTSRVELRKQSFQQSYDPNLYVGKDSVVQKLGRSGGVQERQAVRVLENQNNVLRVTEEQSVRGRSQMVGNDFYKPEVAKVSEYRIQNGRLQDSGVTYSELRSVQSGRTTSQYPDLKSQIGSKARGVKTDNLPGISSKEPYAVLAMKETKQKNVFSMLEKFDSQPRTPTFQSSPLKDNPAAQFVVPEYELTPNAPSQYSGTALARTPRGGAQPGRQKIYEGVRERLLAKKEASRTDFTLVDYYPPQKDLVLNRELNTALAEFSAKNTQLAVRGPDFIPAITNDGRILQTVPGPNTILNPSQNYNVGSDLGRVPVVSSLPDRKQESDLEFKPVVSVLPVQKNTGKELSSAPKVNQDALSSFKLDLAAERVQIPKIESKIDNRQKQKSVSITAFDFDEPTINTGTKETTVPPPIGKEDFFPRERRSEPRTPTQPDYTPPAPRVKFSLLDLKSSDVAEFEISVGSKGNKYYYNLGVGSKDLIDKAESLARNTAAARVRVVPLNAAARGVDVTSLLGNDFRRNKTGDYIQANKTRISSSGEKAQIPGASKYSRLTKGSSYGKALSQSKKGVPLRILRSKRFL